MEQFLNNAAIFENDCDSHRCTQCLKQDSKYFIYKNIAMCFDCVNYYWTKFGKNGIFYAKANKIDIDCSNCEKVLNTLNIPFSNNHGQYCTDCFNVLPDLRISTMVRCPPINLRYYTITN